MSDKGTAAPPVMAAFSLTPWWMNRIREFDGLEVQTCKDNGFFWTVYGHYRPDGKKVGVEALADFENESDAKTFRDRLLEVYPHLVTRSQLRQQPQNKLNP
jgi:hypothetical protein